jgi:hypothetical protein
MKTLLFNLLLSLASPQDAVVADDYRGALDESTVEWTTERTPAADSKVRIFDIAGNLVKEITVAEMETLCADDRRLVVQSSFMFDYQGDSYFLLDK